MHYPTPILIWLAQILLLVAMVIVTQTLSGAAQYSLNYALAITIAALTLAVFMRLRVADGLIRMVALGGLLWLGILALLTVVELLTR